MCSTQIKSLSSVLIPLQLGRGDVCKRGKFILPDNRALTRLGEDGEVGFYTQQTIRILVSNQLLQNHLLTLSNRFLWKKYRLCSLPYQHHPRQINTWTQEESLKSQEPRPQTHSPWAWWLEREGLLPPTNDTQWWRQRDWFERSSPARQSNVTAFWYQDLGSSLLFPTGYTVLSKLWFGLGILQVNPHCWEQFLLEKRPRHRGGKGVDELNRKYQWTLKRRSKNCKVFFKILKWNKKYSLSSDIQKHLGPPAIHMITVLNSVWKSLCALFVLGVCPSLSWYLPDELKLLCVLHY